MKQRVWDRVRGRHLVLTPEEKVRRQVLEFLCGGTDSVREGDTMDGPGLPPTSIAQEYPIRINGMTQRADIVVFGVDGNPLMLVECKAPEVAITGAVLEQAFRYNTVLGARYVMLTNGTGHYLYEVMADDRYVALKEFPELGATPLK